MIRIGILGGAGYTGGELIRLLVNHPHADIKFINSESHAGDSVSDVHEGLLGECDMTFTSAMPLADVDVIFLCFGHGKSEQFLREHDVPDHVRIIDLAQDFRLSPAWVYGLPEVNRPHIRQARRVANPGCFATCIQLALLPLAQGGWLTNDVVVNAVTGSTGAGQKPSPTTHFSWRTGNFSVYKTFAHQHLHEICRTLNAVKPPHAPCIADTLAEGYEACGPTIDFIPCRGDFARGIFCTAVVKLPEALPTEEPPTEESPSSPCPTCRDIIATYKAFYADAAFTHYSDRTIDLKQVVNTNKALVHADVFGRKVVVTACIDNLLKGAVGQAVQNMNLMFSDKLSGKTGQGLDETAGLRLKASAF